MKAIVGDRYGSAEVLRIEEVPTPQPEDGEVVVKVEASSINTADLDHMLGMPRIARLGTGLRRPRHTIPGLDVAGTVVSVSAGVTRLQKGDRVWADMFSHGHGALAEYVCGPQRAFHPVPDDIGFEKAATVPHSAVLALQAMRGKGSLRPGERVLVNGGGGCVGPFAIQIAKAAGAEVVAVDHTDKLELMEEAGADHAIDYTKVDVTKSPTKFDLIVDIAASRPVASYKSIVVEGGRYVQIARTIGGFISAALFGPLIGGDKKMGVFMWEPNKGEDLAHLGHLMEDGRLNPVIDSTCRLSDVPDAMRRLSEQRALGKVVVTP